MNGPIVLAWKPRIEPGPPAKYALKNGSPQADVAPTMTRPLISWSRHCRSLVVPYASLVEADGNNAFVFTPTGTNRVKKIPVAILKYDKEKVYLKNKLEGIEKMVVSNSANLNEKSVIKFIR